MIEYFYKLNEKRYSVLNLIELNSPEGINQSTICSYLNLKSSTVERIVSNLYLMSYLKKKREGNVDMYSITKKGHKSYEILRNLISILKSEK